MKSLILLLVVALAVGASAQCRCESMKWATCDGDPCDCFLVVDNGDRQILNCSTSLDGADVIIKRVEMVTDLEVILFQGRSLSEQIVVPKCFLMKGEMFRARKGLSVRGIDGKPVETAIVDNDGIYDPECESNGLFKAKQCNGTEECWCVNSAGVRRTDKAGKDLQCEELVETIWVRLELKHNETKDPVDPAKLKEAIANAIEDRYQLDKKFVDSIQYDKDARLIVVDIKKDKGDRKVDLPRMAYYMEKDIKVLPLFKDTTKFEPDVDGQKLQLDSILVYYVDEKAPTFTMQRLTGGVIAVIVVVVLAVIAGLVVLFLARRRERAKYEKTQVRELDEIQQALS